MNEEALKLVRAGKTGAVWPRPPDSAPVSPHFFTSRQPSSGNRVSLTRPAVVNGFFHLFFTYKNVFSLSLGTPVRRRGSALLLDGSFFRRQS